MNIKCKKLNVFKLVAALGISAGFATDAQEVLANDTHNTSLNTGTYTVKRGDTLGAIAKEHKLSVNEIVELNNINNPNAIRVGQVLKLNNNTQVTQSSSKSIESVFSNDGVLPVDKSLYGITSRFGPRRNPFNGKQTSFHYGLDIATWNINRQDIRSVLPGRVLYAGYHRGGYGYYVKVQHGDIETLYAHMAEQPAVKTGERVVAGEKLGIVGSTGNSTGPHLHLEVFHNKARVNPEPLMDAILNKNTSSSKPVQTSGSVDSATSYTVLPGDTVSKIAQKHKVSTRDIVQLNGIKNSNLIRVGQRLDIPGGNNSSPKQPVTNNNTVVPKNTDSYTVKSGDTLWSIANKHGMTVQQLKDNNSLQNNLISAGQKLSVSLKSEILTGNDNSPSSTSYTIKRGDSLWKIANAHNMSVKELKQVNNLRSDLIFVGDKLTVFK